MTVSIFNNRDLLPEMRSLVIKRESRFLFRVSPPIIILNILFSPTCSLCHRGDQRVRV